MRTDALPASPTVGPSIRIRHVLLVLILALGGSWALPRGRAAFQLYAAATAFADYGLCMVGPTGPSLIRDNPTEFWRLARRRLVSALADDHPFAKCEKAAALISDSPVLRQAHQASAAAFVEWGADDSTSLKLSDLGIGTRRLAELSERAWPFVRGGYTALVKPSSYAPEAAHPLEPPRPAMGRGVVPHRSVARCVVPEGDGEFVLDLSADRRSKVVRSVARGSTSADVRIAPAEARIFSMSCDAAKVVVGIGREGARDVELVACSFDGKCERMALPRLLADGSPAKFPLDVARIDGVTVVAMTMRGIVRVASSRDDGVSWTPPTVAFDAGERSGWSGETGAPARLVTSGRRLVLLGGGDRAASYWALASDDAGASWHSP